VIALFLLPFFAGQAEAQESSPALVARLQQEQLPELERRQEVAARQRAARQAFLDGEGRLEVAFPGLTDALLSSPAAIQGRLLALDGRIAARAAERIAPPPDADDEALLERHAEALRAALDAEDAADALERRVLLALLAQLRAMPDLTAAGLDELRAPLHARIAAAEVLPAESPERERGLRDAADAAEALRSLDALVEAIRLTALVAGAPPPDPAPDLARLSDPVAAAHAAARLELMLPVLADPAAAQRGLEGWLDGQITTARAALVEATASTGVASELAGVQSTAPAGDLASRHALLHDLTVELARVRATTKTTQNTGVSAERALEQAEVARREAEEATAAARSATERRTAQILRASADAQERTSARWAAARSAEEANAVARSAASEALAEAGADVLALSTRSALLLDRSAADARYAALRVLRTDLRARVRTHEDALLTLQQRAEEAAVLRAEQRAQLAEGRTRLEALDAETAGRLEAALETWTASLDGEEAAEQALLDTTRASRDAAVRSLDEARRLRKELEPMISSQARQAERGLALIDLKEELSMLQPRMRVLVADQILGIRHLPARLLDLNALRSMFVGSFWAFILGGLWWITRRRADEGAERVLAAINQRQVLLNRGDLEPARLPLIRALETLLDLVVGWLLQETIADLSAGLGLVVKLYLYVALFRFLMALYDLLFAQHPTVRPALRILRPEVFERLRRSLRLGLLWVMGRSLLTVVLADTMGLYTLSNMVDSVLWPVGLGLALWLLHGWEPTLRVMIARRQGSALISYLSRPPRTGLLAVPNAIVGVAFLTVTALSDIIPQLAREGSQLGTVLARFSRYRLARGEPEAADPEPLPDEIQARLRAATATEATLDRPESIAALLTGIRRWHETRRRGVFGIVGDRGDGRRTLQASLDQALQAEGFTTRRLTVTTRLRSEAELIRWLGRSLSLPGEPTSLEALISALNEQPESVLHLDGLHRTFLRTVGGFEAIQALLYIIGATAEQHAWVVVLHRPAWRYLSALKDLLNTGVLQTLVELPPVRESQLRAIISARAAEAGVTLDFSHFVQSSPLGADPDVEQEKAVRVFYRLLVEASGGRVAVAVRMWLSCLTPGQDGVVRVWAHPCLSQTDLPDLKVGELLTLTLLLIQERLTEAELAELLEIAPGRLRASLKDLQARGLLERLDDELIIAPVQIPVVTRTLRRRNFVQWS
jgi:colicin import membrane protein